MKAIIHCAGKGTRVPEVSKFMPKPMVEINGKPLLYWNIQYLKKYGIKEIYITLHHISEKILDYFKDGKEFGVTIRYFYEKKLLGTGGAILPLNEKLTADTIVLYGDVVSQINYKKLLSFHKKRKALVTAVTHPSLHPEDSDLVKFDNNFRLTKILNKPHSRKPKSPYNLAGLYVVNPKIFKYLTMKTPFSFESDLLSGALRNNERIFCYNTQEFIMDIGTPERLKKAKELIK